MPDEKCFFVNSKNRTYASLDMSNIMSNNIFKINKKRIDKVHILYLIEKNQQIPVKFLQSRS